MTLTAVLLSLLPNCCSTVENKKESATDSSSSYQVIKAVEAKTEFDEINNKKIAHRSVGSGTPIILFTKF